MKAAIVLLTLIISGAYAETSTRTEVEVKKSTKSSTRNNLRGNVNSAILKASQEARAIESVEKKCSRDHQEVTVEAVVTSSSCTTRHGRGNIPSTVSCTATAELTCATTYTRVESTRDWSNFCRACP